MEKMHEVLKKKYQSIFLVIAILALIGVVYVVVRKKPLPLREEKTATGISIPSEVHVYNGIVQEERDREFVLQSSSSENYLTEDSMMIVRYNEHTQFVKNSVSRILPQGASFPVISEAAALASDINLGALVVVYSDKNIAGEKNFLADKVIILNISHSPVQ